MDEEGVLVGMSGGGEWVVTYNGREGGREVGFRLC